MRPASFGGLALVVVKVSRHGDNGLFHRFTQEGFRVFFHFLQDESRQLLGRKFLPAQIIFVIFPHFAFKRGDRTFRVGDGLPARRFPNQALAVFGESHIRREGFAADGACLRQTG